MRLQSAKSNLCDRGRNMSSWFSDRVWTVFGFMLESFGLMTSCDLPPLSEGGFSWQHLVMLECTFRGRRNNLVTLGRCFLRRAQYIWRRWTATCRGARNVVILGRHLYWHVQYLVMLGRYFFRGKRNIWGCWKVTPVAARIVLDISFMREDYQTWMSSFDCPLRPHRLLCAMHGTFHVSILLSIPLVAQRNVLAV